MTTRRFSLSDIEKVRVVMGTCLSVYAGAGGLDLGLEYAGFRPIVCLDTDAAARATLAANRPDWYVPASGNVSDAAFVHTPSSFDMQPGDLDLLAGGPPCQPFSKAAQWAPSARRGMSDPRAASLQGFLALVEAFQPRAILIENVAGYIRGPGSAIKPLSDGLASINGRRKTSYSINAEIVDSADVGVPQHRQRAIIVAFRDGRSFQLQRSPEESVRRTAWDALHDLVEKDEEKPRAGGSWTQLLPSIPEGGNYQWLTSRGGGEELFGWRTRYWSFLLKLAKDRPSWTIPASPGPNTGPFHWDDRPLSIRERLRIQSFPDSWMLTGSFREQARLVGNATPPLLAEVLGAAIGEELGLNKGDHRLRLKIPHVSSSPAPRSPLPVPQAFLGLVRPRGAHPGTGLGPSPRVPVHRDFID